jgi:hypothetical protein
MNLAQALIDALKKTNKKIKIWLLQ